MKDKSANLRIPAPQISDEDTYVTVTAESNIFRSEVQAIDLGNHTKGQQPGKPAWVEKATICQCVLQECNVGTYPHSHSWYIPENRSHARKYPRQGYIRSASHKVAVIVLLDPLPTILVESSSGPTTAWSPFVPAVPRSRPTVGLEGFHLDIDAAIARLVEYTDIANPLGQDLLTWLREDGVTDEHIDIFSALLQVIRIDMYFVLDQYSGTLDSISIGLSSEKPSQEQLSLWRFSMAPYALELPRMIESVQSLRRYFTSHTSSTSAEILTEQILARIRITMEQSDKVYASLRTEISIIDSSRSIAEAESIGKLTELAFVFIPLAFVAGVFSMQVQALQTPAQLRSVLAGAAITLGISYGIRLALRSDLISEPKRMLFNRIRKDARIPATRPVSTRTFLLHIMQYIIAVPTTQRFGYLFVLGGILAPLIALLWVEVKLETSFKILLSVLLVFVVICVTVAAESPNIADCIARSRSRHGHGDDSESSHEDGEV